MPSERDHLDSRQCDLFEIRTAEYCACRWQSRWRAAVPLEPGGGRTATKCRVCGDRAR
jgi:hypothetical protein